MCLLLCPTMLQDFLYFLSFIIHPIILNANRPDLEGVFIVTDFNCKQDLFCHVTNDTSCSTMIQQVFFLADLTDCTNNIYYWYILLVFNIW